VNGAVRGLAAAVLLAGCAGAGSAPPASPPHRYALAATLGEPAEWRFQPLVVDVDRDGHLDLVATARLVKNYLTIWLGDGKLGFRRLPPTWADLGYGAVATGDVNGDGWPDFVAASHFPRLQVLLSDGRGGFTDSIVPRNDGHVAAQLVDVDSDGKLDLILLGFQHAGLEILLADGVGTWTRHRALPEIRPGRTMPGRALAVGDLDRDGHVDVVAAFNRWGIYVYHGDGRGGFTGGHTDLAAESREFQALALADVNRDGHLDLVINGTSLGRDRANGPDVYLGDGRGGWKASSRGLKVLRVASIGLGVGDLDGDGFLDIVAAGNQDGDAAAGYGLFWFRGDGTGGWRLVEDSGLPTKGLSVPHSITLADLDRDGALEIVVLSGGQDGRFTIWRKEPPARIR
jgi:hypothetical protein